MKKRFHVQNCPCRMVGVIAYVLGLLVHGKVVVEFGRKVFLVDCLLRKTLYMAKISITERTHTFSCTQNSMRYRNDDFRSVLLHNCANLAMMLARDYTSCHAATSTLVMLVVNNVQKLRWPAKSLDLNPINHLLDLLKHKVRPQSQKLNLRELTHVIHYMFAFIPQQYIHRYILTMIIRYLAVDVTPGGCTMY